MGKHTEALPSFIMRHLSALLCLSCAISSTSAAVCVNGGNANISTFDINTAAQELASPNYPGPHSYSIASNGFVAVSFNSALFCLQNLSGGTENALAPDIAIGANEISSKCCPDTMCAGGIYLFDEKWEAYMTLNVMAAGAQCY